MQLTTGTAARRHRPFDYEDFRDLRVTGVPPGSDSFDANVLQVFLWF